MSRNMNVYISKMRMFGRMFWNINGSKFASAFIVTRRFCSKIPEVLQIDKMDSGKGFEVKWSNGEKSRFHSSWLRMNCHCDQCHQQHSGQREINVGLLPQDISLEGVNITENSSEVMVSWKQEQDHKSVYKLDWLKKHSYSKEDIERQSLKRKFEALQGTEPPSVNYTDVMSTDTGLLQWLLQLNEHGLSVVRGLPNEEDSVCKVGRKMGPILETIYGNLFDVISMPKPINIAYSSARLPLHMDLAYYQSPPGIQMLHCMRFDPQVVGGNSILLDIFAVAEQFRETHPEEFNTLVRVPATFQKIHFERDYPVYLKYQRPHISLNHRKEIVAVTWSPPFEGPLFVDEEDVEPYYEAYRAFDEQINNSPLQFSFKLEEGDMVSFNNIRVLHGREEFELNGGVRKLKGVYVNIDEFRNKVDVMSQLKGDAKLSKRVGNNCFF